ncbi:hypothetical protein DPV78_001092 [Talaromyces pinophilus]|nr:hypothetical protein DPV78_001092 [Talaromyces pinophilus]
MLSRTSSSGSEIEDLPLPNEWKVLIRDLLRRGIKISPRDVRRIWELALNRMNHIEGLVSQTLWV